MIDRTHDLPLARQATLLQLSRSSLYYAPQPVPEADLRDHAPDRRAASGAPVRGQPDVA